MNNLCIKNVTQELSNLSYLFTYVTVNLLMVCTFRLGGMLRDELSLVCFHCICISLADLCNMFGN